MTSANGNYNVFVRYKRHKFVLPLNRQGMTISFIGNVGHSSSFR